MKNLSEVLKEKEGSISPILLDKIYLLHGQSWTCLSDSNEAIWGQLLRSRFFRVSLFKVFQPCYSLDDLKRKTVAKTLNRTLRSILLRIVRCQLIAFAWRKLRSLFWVLRWYCNLDIWQFVIKICDNRQRCFHFFSEGHFQVQEGGSKNTYVTNDTKW